MQALVLHRKQRVAMTAMVSAEVIGMGRVGACRVSLLPPYGHQERSEKLQIGSAREARHDRAPRSSIISANFSQKLRRQLLHLH